MEAEQLFEDFFTDGVDLIVYATIEKYEPPPNGSPGYPETITINDYEMVINDNILESVGNYTINQFVWNMYMFELFNQMTVMQKELFCRAIDADIIETVEEKIGRE